MSSSSSDPPSKKHKLDESTSTSPHSNDQPHDFHLYSYWRSSCSWRVRIALHLKGIPFHYHAINLLKNQQSDEEYNKINHQHKVPTLVYTHRGVERVITQSLAILDFLESLNYGPKLISNDPYTRAQQLSLSLILVADTQPVQNLSVLNRVKDITGSDEHKMQWGTWSISNGLNSLEAEVQNTHGDYAVGDHISWVDICIIPQLYNARRFNVDVSAYPTLLAIESKMAANELVQKAHPDQCPDAVKA